MAFSGPARVKAYVPHTGILLISCFDIESVHRALQ